MFSKTFTILLSTALVIGASPAAVLWDQTAGDGPLSNDYLLPTLLAPAMVGSNTVALEVPSGRIGQGHFVFNIPAGHQLNAVVLESYDNFGAGGGSFAGFQVGAQLSAPPTLDNSFPDPINFVLVGDSLVGFDLLPFMANQADPTAPRIPVGPGNLVFWVQETRIDAEFELDFQVSAVPEPTSALLFSILGAAFALRRQRTS